MTISQHTKNKVVHLNHSIDKYSVNILLILMLIFAVTILKFQVIGVFMMLAVVGLFAILRIPYLYSNWGIDTSIYNHLENEKIVFTKVAKIEYEFTKNQHLIDQNGFKIKRGEEFTIIGISGANFHLIDKNGRQLAIKVMHAIDRFETKTRFRSKKLRRILN